MYDDDAVLTDNILCYLPFSSNGISLPELCDAMQLDSPTSRKLPLQKSHQFIPRSKQPRLYGSYVQLCSRNSPTGF